MILSPGRPSLSVRLLQLQFQAPVPFDVHSDLSCFMKRPRVLTKSISPVKSPVMCWIQWESKYHIFGSLAAVVDSASGILANRAADGPYDDSFSGLFDFFSGQNVRLCPLRLQMLHFPRDLASYVHDVSSLFI